MMKHITTIVVLLVSAFTLVAQDDTEQTGTVIHVAPYQQSCTGVAPQDCLIVRFEDDDDLSFFYDAIEGFSFEEGFEYTLLVNITERENVPADASSLEYELIEILQQFPAHLDGKVWELQSLHRVQIEDPSLYTFMLTDDGVAMKADCNNVLGNLTFDPFDIETTVSTRAMCPPDSLDTEYLAALNAANLISIENGELILQSSDGQLRFAPPSIDGTEWTLTRVLGMATMLELDDSVAYTLQVDDTDVSMAVACNTAGGTIDVDGAILRFTQVAMTKMFCENDPLMGMFPPENVIYYITETGHLILEDETSMLYDFISTEVE